MKVVAICLVSLAAIILGGLYGLFGASRFCSFVGGRRRSTDRGIFNCQWWLSSRDCLK